jgi:hypothetical protein
VELLHEPMVSATPSAAARASLLTKAEIEHGGFGLA